MTQGIHQITIFSSGKILITRQYSKSIRKFNYKVIDPSKFCAKLYSLPCTQFAVGRGYTLFVKGK